MDDSTLERLAEFICGDGSIPAPTYRTGRDLTTFFQRAGLTGIRHDGSTRKWWTLEVLRNCSRENLQSVLLRLSSPAEYGGDAEGVATALRSLNVILSVEGVAVELNGVVPRLFRKAPSVVPGSGVAVQPRKVDVARPDFATLSIEAGVAPLLSERWSEAERCLNGGAFLAATIIMGSLLEGLLLAVVQSNPKVANTAACAPRDQSGKVRRFQDWSLSQLIDVAHSVGWLDLDVKEFSHALREFRNLVHPYHQFALRAFPDHDTCEISWRVVRAATNDLVRVLSGSRGD